MQLTPLQQQQLLQQQQQYQQQYQQYPQQYPSQYPQQYPQQSYQPQPLTPEQTTIMTNYYNEISHKLFQILNTENGKRNIDGLNLFQLAIAENDIPQSKMNNVFKHLLRYTYSAKAEEIANHQEINMQLKEIKATIVKLLKEQKPGEAPPSG